MNANFEKQQAFTNSEEEKVGVLQKTRATLENQVDALKMTLNTEQNSRMKLGRENQKLEADLTLSQKNIDQMKASFQVAFKAEENQSNEKNKEQQALIKKLYGKVEKREGDLKNEQKSRALLQTAHDDLARKLEELSEQSEEAASNFHEADGWIKKLLVGKEIITTPGNLIYTIPKIYPIYVFELEIKIPKADKSNNDKVSSRILRVNNL